MRAARWTLTLRGNVNAPQLADALVRIHYQEDVARLNQNGHLLDDDFWNGLPWTFGARQSGMDTALPINLEVLPLPQTYPMYLQHQPDTVNSGSTAVLQSIKAIPVYRWTFTSRPN